MRVLLSLVVSVVIGFFAIGCSSFEDKPLVVGVTPNLPPLVSIKDGKLVGFEIDLMNRVGEMIGRKIQYKRYPLTQLKRALLDGEVDIVIGGISRTVEREKNVSFTYDIAKGGQMHIVRVEDFSKYAHPDLINGMKGVRIGVENATTGDDYATKTFKNAKIMRYDSAKTALWALKKKDIDIVIHDAPTSWSCKEKELTPVYQALTTEYYAWAFRKGDEKKLKPVNDALFELKKSLELRSLWLKWVPMTTTVTYGK